MTLLFLLACGDPCEAGPSPTLEIGAGLDEFVPLTAGDEVPIIYGPQGGFHINLAFRATYLAIHNVISADLRGSIDGQVVAESNPWFNLQCTDTFEEATGVRLLLVESPPELHQSQLTISVELTDADGTTITSEAEVTPIDPRSTP